MLDRCLDGGVTVMTSLTVLLVDLISVIVNI